MNQVSLDEVLGGLNPNSGIILDQVLLGLKSDSKVKIAHILFINELEIEKELKSKGFSKARRHMHPVQLCQILVAPSEGGHYAEKTLTGFTDRVAGIIKGKCGEGYFFYSRPYIPFDHEIGQVLLPEQMVFGHIVFDETLVGSKESYTLDARDPYLLHGLTGVPLESFRDLGDGAVLSFSTSWPLKRACDVFVLPSMAYALDAANSLCQVKGAAVDKLRSYRHARQPK